MKNTLNGYQSASDKQLCFLESDRWTLNILVCMPLSYVEPCEQFTCCMNLVCRYYVAIEPKASHRAFFTINCFLHGKQVDLSCAKAKTRLLYSSDINEKGRLSMVFQWH